MNAWNAILLAHLHTFHAFAWIQHEFNMNSTLLSCKVLHKAFWDSSWKMRSAWNQHECSMNSAWDRHELNTSRSLIQKQLAPPKFGPKSWKKTSSTTPNLRIIDYARIQRESDMNLTLMIIQCFIYWFCMNPAWIQHEFNTIRTAKSYPEIAKPLDFLRRFGLAVRNFGLQKLISSPYWGNAWIQHECILQHFDLPKFQTTNPNHHSKKSTFKNLVRIFLNFSPNFHRIRFMPLSCRFQASIYTEFMWFMPDSVEFSLASHPHSIIFFFSHAVRAMTAPTVVQDCILFAHNSKDIKDLTRGGSNPNTATKQKTQTQTKQANNKTTSQAIPKNEITQVKRWNIAN